MKQELFNEPVTRKQRALIRKLTLSSAFSSSEADATTRWLDGPAATKSAASILIDRALGRIREKNLRAKESRRRKDDFHAAKAPAKVQDQEDLRKAESRARIDSLKVGEVFIERPDSEAGRILFG